MTQATCTILVCQTIKKKTSFSIIAVPCAETFILSNKYGFTAKQNAKCQQILQATFKRTINLLGAWMAC